MLSRKKSIYFLVCKGQAIDIYLSRDTVYQEIRLGVGLKAGDFITEKLGRLPYNDLPAPRSHHRRMYALFPCVHRRMYALLTYVLSDL